MLALRQHAKRKIFDYALVNTARVSAALAAKYLEQGCKQVECDAAEFDKLGVKCVPGDFLEEADVARHNTHEIARKIIQLARLPRAAGAAN